MGKKAQKKKASNVATLLPATREPAGFQTRDLAQITDDLIARQEMGPAGTLGLPPVFAVVRLVASTIDQLPLTVDGAPPPDWLRSPRKYGGQLDLGDLIQWLITSMALTGAGYLRVMKTSGESWQLDAVHPGYVQVQPSASGVVSLTYLLDGRPIPTVPPWTRDRGIGVPYLLPVPYLVTPDFPAGVSPVTACRLSLAGYGAVEGQASSLIDRGTYSGGRLETDQEITEATAIRYQDKWVENRKVGKLPVLGAGLHYVNDLISPSDAQWLESRQFNSQQIAMMFGIPPDYLGMSMSGGSSSLSYANAQDNDRRFRRNGLEAFTSQIEDALTLLTPPGRSADETQQVRFDYDSWETSGAASGNVGSPTDTGTTEPGWNPDVSGVGRAVWAGDRIRRVARVVLPERVRSNGDRGNPTSVVPSTRRTSWPRDSSDEHTGRADSDGNRAAHEPGERRDDTPPVRIFTRPERRIRTDEDEGVGEHSRIRVRRTARTVLDTAARIFRRGSDRDSAPGE